MDFINIKLIFINLLNFINLNIKDFNNDILLFSSFRNNKIIIITLSVINYNNINKLFIIYIFLFY